VRYYYANKAAVSAAKAGKSLPDGSVLFAECMRRRSAPTASRSWASTASSCRKNWSPTRRWRGEAGWGKDIPEMLRQRNWNYAVFTNREAAAARREPGRVLGCHKPLDNVSYTFTLKQLAAAK